MDIIWVSIKNGRDLIRFAHSEVIILNTIVYLHKIMDEKKRILDKLEKKAAHLTKAEFSKIMDEFIDKENNWLFHRSAARKTVALIKEIFERVPKNLIQAWFEHVLLEKSLDLIVYKELLTGLPELITIVNVDTLLTMVLNYQYPRWNLIYPLLLLNSSLRSNYFQILTNLIVDSINEVGHGPMPQLMKSVRVLCHHMNSLGVFTPLEHLAQNKVNLYPIVLELAHMIRIHEPNLDAFKIAQRIIEQYRPFVNWDDIDKFLKVCSSWLSDKYALEDGLKILASSLKHSADILKQLRKKDNAFSILQSMFIDLERYRRTYTGLAYVLEQTIPLLRKDDFTRLLRTLESDRFKEVLRTYKTVLEQDNLSITLEKVVTFFSPYIYGKPYIKMMGEIILEIILKKQPSFFTNGFDRLYKMVSNQDYSGFHILVMAIRFCPHLIEQFHIEKIKKLLNQSQGYSTKQQFAMKLIEEICIHQPNLIREQDIHGIGTILKTEYCDLVYAMNDATLRTAFNATLTILRKRPSIIKQDHLRSFLRRLNLLGGHLDLNIIMDGILNIIRHGPKSSEMVLKMFLSMFEADYAYHSLPGYIRSLFKRGLAKEDAVRLLLEGTKINNNSWNLQVLSEIETVSGNNQQALIYLRKALEITNNDEYWKILDVMEDSEDLEPLHELPEYQELLKEQESYLRDKKIKEEKFEKELTKILIKFNRTLMDAFVTHETPDVLVSETLKQCKACGSTNILTDVTRWEKICNFCGLVIKKRPESHAIMNEENGKGRTKI